MNGKDDLVLDTKRLIGAIGDTMAAVSRFLEDSEDNERENPVCKVKCDYLRANEEQLKKLLRDSLWAVKHQWNEIAGNPMLLEDLKAYIGCCRDFLKQTWEFDDLVQRHWFEADALFGRNDIGRRYLQDMLVWEDEAKAIIGFIESKPRVGVRLDDVFDKAALKLRPYFEDVTGAALQNFVMNGVSLAGRPRWKLDKRQAIVMGKMLGKSCKEMNDSFRFINQDDKYIKLNYTSHGPVLEYDQYAIYPILKEMLDAVKGE